MLLIIYLLALVESINLPHQSILTFHKKSQLVPTKYQSLNNFFKQSNPNTNNEIFNITEDFGLYSNYSWDYLVNYLYELNDKSKDKRHKLVFLQRHGEGYHNVASSLYNRENWTCYWQLQNGNDKIKWHDARLTEKGINQAKQMATKWKHEVHSSNVPVPQSFYVSPLRRTLETHRNIWDLISPLDPIVKENARETYGIGTESRRHSKSYIQTNYPFARIEEDFEEFDLLWNQTHHESSEHRKYRANLLLNDIFTNDTNLVISLVSHSGLISSILRLINHRKWSLRTGQMIPVVIEASEFGNFKQSMLNKPWGNLDNCRLYSVFDM